MSLEITCRFISQLANNKSNGTQLVTMLNQVMNDLNTHKYCVLSGKLYRLYTFTIRSIFLNLMFIYLLLINCVLSICRPKSYYSLESCADTSRSAAHFGLRSTSSARLERIISFWPMGFNNYAGYYSSQIWRENKSLLTLNSLGLLGEYRILEILPCACGFFE